MTEMQRLLAMKRRAEVALAELEEGDRHYVDTSFAISMLYEILGYRWDLGRPGWVLGLGEMTNA